MANRQLLLLRTKPTTLETELESLGWTVLRTTGIDESKTFLSKGECRVGIVVFESADSWNLSELERLTSNRPYIEWIAICPAELFHWDELATVVRDNFFDFVTPQIDITRISVIVGHAFGMATLGLNRGGALVRKDGCGLDGSCAAMREAYVRVKKFSCADTPVLIRGESGTGKELIARALHKYSHRRNAPFIAVNCGGLPGSLIHAELFGHEKGAFTGAHRRKIGSIEAAAPGVIFLDEIGDLPRDLQATLLRFLEQKTITRVGSTESIPVNVRVISATNIDLERSITSGAFREDLFYRLSVLQLTLPPLRARGQDIESLAYGLLDALGKEHPSMVRGFSRGALGAMQTHLWPGNVREMRNRILQALVMSENRLITEVDLGLFKPSAMAHAITLDSARARLERDIISATLAAHNNNVTEAARQLKISRMTLYRRMSKFAMGAAEPEP